MEIRIEQTVVNALVRSAGTYTTLCRDLDAYEPGAVVAAIDRLRARGVVHLGEDRRLTHTGVKDGFLAADKPSNSSKSVSSEAVAKSIQEKPFATEGNSSVVVLPRRPALLKSTSVSALGLKGSVEQCLRGAGIETVGQLVARVGTLVDILGEDDAVTTLRSMIEASNDSPCWTYGDKDKNALSALSKSVSFYFDWLDSLCTFLDRSCSDSELRAVLKREQGVTPGKHGYSTHHLTGYGPDVREACAIVRRGLLDRSYPLRIDAFETIVMPVIDEAFGMGEVESVEEAARYITSFFEESPSTVRSLMGVLEERAARAAASRDRSLEGFVTVGVPGSFARAAEDLAHADDRYTYDSRGRMLRFACR